MARSAARFSSGEPSGRPLLEPHRTGPGARPGFTLLELIFVLAVGGVLAGMAVPPITAYWQGRQAVQARSAFAGAAAEARISAVERGDVVLLTTRPGTDSVLVTERDGTVIEVLDLRSEELQADLVGPELTLCYVPRGYADPSCQDGGSLPAMVGFASGADTVWAEVTLGQVVRR